MNTIMMYSLRVTSLYIFVVTLILTNQHSAAVSSNAVISSQKNENRIPSLSLVDRIGNRFLQTSKKVAPLSIFQHCLYQQFNRQQDAILPLQGIMKDFVLRGLHRPRLVVSTVIASSALSCNFLINKPSAAYALQDVDDNQNYAIRMNKKEVITRTVSFWRKAAPIIMHYKFTQTWIELNNRNRNRNRNQNNAANNYFDQQRRDELYHNLHERYAPQALDIILQMRGLFIKIGQVLSARPDFVPSQYVEAFGRVQDNVPHWESQEILDIITKSLSQHLGLSFQQVFQDFETIPIGSASIGQVHEATLSQKLINGEFMQHDLVNRKNTTKNKNIRDNEKKSYSGGTRVAVKVMHMDAEDRFRNDFKIFKWLCRVALPGWSPLLRELEGQMMTEFNYLNEGSNLQRVRSNMKASPYKNQVVVPEPFLDICTPNVLIMEMLDGVKLETAVLNDLTRVLKGDKKLAKSIIEEKRTALFRGSSANEANSSNHSSLQNLRQILKKISHYPRYQQLYTALQLSLLQRKNKKTVELLLNVHGHQIFSNGIFNGDPHPGNILTLKNGKMGLIDYGQCKTLCDDDQIALSKVVGELGAVEVNDTAVAAAMNDFGFRFKYNNDRNDIIREVARLFFDSDNGRRDVGCATPQEYLVYLESQNPIVTVPDAAVFVARTSYLFRGMGSLLGLEVNTSEHWKKSIR